MKRTVNVVGAGPAGIIATAALVQSKCKVVWVDTADAFSSVGRLGQFSNVHSNTKVELVARWFEEGVLADAVDGCPHSKAAVANLRASARKTGYPDHGDPYEGLVMLGDIVRVMDGISNNLRSHKDVTVVHGRASRLELTTTTTGNGNGNGNGRREGGGWTSYLDNGAVAARNADAVILAIGALPKPLPKWLLESKSEGKSPEVRRESPEPRIVSGELAVDAVKLANAVRPGERIALMGTSHSAALVAMHLHNMRWPVTDLEVFGRSPPKQAEWIGGPAQYRWSATGLKGIASAFFADQVRTASASPSPSPSFPFLEPKSPALLKEAAVRNRFDVIIPTIGYRTATLPEVLVDGSVVDVHPTGRDPDTSELMLRHGCTTSETGIFRPGHYAPSDGGGSGDCEKGPLSNGSVPGLCGIGVGWPDYFEELPAPNAGVGTGFGGPPSLARGVAGENYVGFNAMIERASRIAQAIGSSPQ